MVNKKLKKIKFSFNLSEVSVLWGLCIQERLRGNYSAETLYIITDLENKLSIYMDNKAKEMMTDLFKNSVEEEAKKRGEL